MTVERERRIKACNGTTEIAYALVAMFMAYAVSWLALQKPQGGSPILAPEALLTTQVEGLKATSAAANLIDVSGNGFSTALRVIV